MKKEKILEIRKVKKIIKKSSTETSSSNERINSSRTRNRKYYGAHRIPALLKFE